MRQNAFREAIHFYDDEFVGNYAFRRELAFERTRRRLIQQQQNNAGLRSGECEALEERNYDSLVNEHEQIHKPVDSNKSSFLATKQSTPSFTETPKKQRLLQEECAICSEAFFPS